MKIDLLNQSGLRQFLQSYLDSQEWWMLVWDASGAQTVIAIEETYYEGEASADFEAFSGRIGRFPFVSISLARKSRMTAQQLAAMMTKSLTPITAQDLAQRDVLFLCNAPYGQALAGKLCLFLQAEKIQAAAKLN